VWIADDEDDGATRIEAFDPSKLEALAAAAAAAAAERAVEPEVVADAMVDSASVDADADGDSALEAAPKSLRADTLLPVEVEEPSEPAATPWRADAGARQPAVAAAELDMDEPELTQASSFPPPPSVIPARPRVISIPTRASRPSLDSAIKSPAPGAVSEEPSAEPDVQALVARIDMDLDLPVTSQGPETSPSSSATGSDIQTSLARIDMSLEPLGPGVGVAPSAPPPSAYAPGAAPTSAPYAPPSMFEMGPEPTQIGARPLISFGDTSPLTALVGERQHQSAVQVHGASEPRATFLPDTKPSFYRDRRVQIAVALVVCVLIGVILIVAL
jgi:hypothetical protein